MIKSRVLGLTVLGCMAILSAAYAKDTSTSTGILLKTSTSIRAEGMGGAQAAVITDEAGAAGWNPAGLLGNCYPGVSAVYHRGLADDMFGAVQFEMPVNESLAAGGGLTYYDAGSFELNSAAGEDSTVSAQRDFLAVFTTAYGMSLLQSNAVFGANLKFLQSTLLGKYSAFAAAVDLGTRWDLQGMLKGLQLGGAIKNLGTSMKYIESADALPAYALLGAGYPVYRSTGFAALIAGDVQYDLESKWVENLGAEFRLADLVAVRAGYKLGTDLGSFTVGVGFNYANISLDYAFSAMQSLNSLHSASLKYTFGPDAETAKAQVEAEQEPAYQPPDIQPQVEGPSEKIPTAVAEIRRAGGRVTEVVLNIGAEQGIKAGFKGSLLDGSGRPLGGFIIRQVDPKLSLADVIGLGRDIGNDATAVIDKPIMK